jgi:hypothetical protein
VAAGLGKPAAGDADMGDVAPQLNLISGTSLSMVLGISPLFRGQTAKKELFCLLVTLFLGALTWQPCKSASVIAETAMKTDN